MKRRRFKDKCKIGGSRLIPYNPYEDAMSRHTRRLTFNLQNQDFVKRWAEKAQVVLTITNEGHHWKFVKGKRTFNGGQVVPN